MCDSTFIFNAKDLEEFIKVLLCTPKAYSIQNIDKKVTLQFTDCDSKVLQKEIYEWLKVRVRTKIITVSSTFSEEITLRKLQEEQKPWVIHNFGDRPSWMPLLGLMEELGELAHAHLKEAQGIRLEENHIENAKDAVADIVIF